MSILFSTIPLSFPSTTYIFFPVAASPTLSTISSFSPLYFLLSSLHPTVNFMFLFRLSRILFFGRITCPNNVGSTNDYLYSVSLRTLMLFYVLHFYTICVKTDLLLRRIFWTVTQICATGVFYEVLQKETYLKSDRRVVTRASSSTLSLHGVGL